MPAGVPQVVFYRAAGWNQPGWQRFYVVRPNSSDSVLSQPASLRRVILATVRGERQGHGRQRLGYQGGVHSSYRKHGKGKLAGVDVNNPSDGSGLW
jgi:hypothetical protein